MVDFGLLGDQGQAQSRSLSGRLGAPREPFQHRRSLCDRDSGTVVVHSD
jgi:hypothetical protein